MLTRSQKAQSRLTGQEERGRALSPTLALPSAGRHMTPGGLPLSLAAAISCSEVADSIQPILENTNVRGEEGWGGVKPKINFLIPLAPVSATSQGVSLPVNVRKIDDPREYAYNLSKGPPEVSSNPRYVVISAKGSYPVHITRNHHEIATISGPASNDRKILRSSSSVPKKRRLCWEKG